MNRAIHGNGVCVQRSYEMKFVAPDAVADEVLAWARASLAPDQVGGRNGFFRVRSLYFDTPDLDIYHRVGKFGRRKYRVRRYGEEPAVYLEGKKKSKGQVRERRSTIAADELQWLADHHETSGWAGDWFHRDLLRWQIGPVCRIDYERLLHAGVADGQPVQLSVDRHVRCAPASAISLNELGDPTRPVTDGNERIVEIRFLETLPTALKALVWDLNLTTRGVSKYRLAMRACAIEGNPHAR